MVTLSAVMAAWAGMSTTSTRRVTFTTRSIIGKRTTMPGPLAPSRMWPSRKNTARSYSVTMIRIDGRTMNSSTATMAPATIRPVMATSLAPPPAFWLQLPAHAVGNCSQNGGGSGLGADGGDGLGQRVGFEDVGHHADLGFPDVVGDVGVHLVFEHVVSQEAQLGPGQGACVRGITHDHRLCGDGRALRVGRADQHEQVGLVVGLGRPEYRLLALQVHGPSGGSDEALGGHEDHVGAGCFRAGGDGGAGDPVPLADGDHFLSLEHVFVVHPLCVAFKRHGFSREGRSSRRTAGTCARGTGCPWRGAGPDWRPPW